MALLALELKPGDAVFVPSFTYVATAEAILMGQGTPVFVEVDEASFNIDLQDLEARIEAVIKGGVLKPKAIIAVDLFGQPADYPGLTSASPTNTVCPSLPMQPNPLGGKSGNTDDPAHWPIARPTSFYPTKAFGLLRRWRHDFHRQRPLGRYLPFHPRPWRGCASLRRGAGWHERAA